MAKISQAARTEALEMLRDLIKPGSTVYVINRHTSKSGVMRVLSPVVMTEDGPRHLSYNVARVLGLAYDRERSGVKIGGCGMDMGFAMVHDLEHALGYESYSLKHAWL